MRKLAHIAYSGPSGATDLAVTLATAGRAAGLAQTLAFWGNEPAPPDRLTRCEDAGLDSTVFKKKNGADWSAQRAVKQWAADRLDADAFIVHYPAALIAIRSAFTGHAKPRKILVEHNSNALKRLHHWALSAFAFWFCDSIVYLTEEYREQVRRKLGPLFLARKTTVIANGLDLAKYQRPRLLQPHTTEKTFVIGMSGRMVPGKDFATLLNAFSILCARHFSTPLHLELAGDGPQRAALEQLSVQLGIASHVTFTGNLPHETLIHRMWTWDAFALSTLGETQSLSLMEAMACGLPCVATDVGGVREMIDNGKTALLVPAGDSAGMADAISKLIEHPEIAAALAKSGHAIAQQKFSSARMFSNYYNLLEGP